jgi:hypothetical protein
MRAERVVVHLRVERIFGRLCSSSKEESCQNGKKQTRKQSYLGMIHVVPHLLLRYVLKTRARELNVHDVARWNKLYHEEHGIVLLMKGHPLRGKFVPSDTLEMCNLALRPHRTQQFQKMLIKMISI